MGLDIQLFPISPNQWESNHIVLSTRICCERCAGLFFQIDAYGEPPDDPADIQAIPYPVVKPQPVPSCKFFYIWEHESAVESDRIGESDGQSNFLFLWARDFHAVNVQIIEHHIARAAVWFMRELPGDWPVLVWRA